MEIFYLVLGLVILLLAGDALVRGAVNLSLRVGIPALIVSLTVVAFGTSAPELLISVNAVLKNVPGLALGNVVGSNTANVLLVLGIPALLSGIYMSDCDSKRSYLMMLAASLLFIGLCFFGPLHWLHGLILLAALALMLGENFFAARKHRADSRAAAAEAADVEILEEADPHMPGWRIGLFLVLGLVGLPLGADILVDNAEIIARRFGVSDTVIGLTIVALGTSLPELATTVMAGFRRQADVALGNVIGSNMFNLLGIIGVAALFGKIPVDESFLRFDLWVMLGASLILVPFVMYCRNITRAWGAALTAAYIVYVYFVVAGGVAA
ncbi:sodium:proton exchanger [Maritimibacter sp. 55A14]|uniref:calcium/sodium antiporter n=1 Tax=Maritimibacter sp. 55A14 TaxID=2174844 RepID=UPI000D606F4F|nr:calcium/sodium antiporter [Maritimibacter sp. 55A14]PWE32563.1 sodium:proton exchanger [Maritimibacter sp. 55A14]